MDHFSGGHCSCSGDYWNAIAWANPPKHTMVVTGFSSEQSSPLGPYKEKDFGRGNELFGVTLPNQANDDSFLVSSGDGSNDDSFWRTP